MAAIYHRRSIAAMTTLAQPNEMPSVMKCLAAKSGDIDVKTKEKKRYDARKRHSHLRTLLALSVRSFALVGAVAVFAQALSPTPIPVPTPNTPRTITDEENAPQAAPTPAQIPSDELSLVSGADRALSGPDAFPSASSFDLSAGDRAAKAMAGEEQEPERQRAG